MLQIIISRIALGKTRDEKINLLREFLQIVVLKFLSDRGVFQNIAFLGGTSLRVLHGLQRFSEDLDFSVYSKTGYDWLTILDKMKSDLDKLGFEVMLKYKTGIVDNCFINFQHILYDLGLSNMKSQSLSIKLEVDTHPPQGYRLENKIINDVFIFPIKVFDLPSLMAGKLHAILFRGFDKGRDWYDLIWYLSKNIQPNTLLLKNAILQTQKDKKLADSNRKTLLKKKIEKVDFNHLKKDVEKFLMNSSELNLFTKEYFLDVL